MDINGGRDIELQDGADSSRVLGPLLHVLPTCIQLDGAVSIQALLRYLVEWYTSTLPHQHIDGTAVAKRLLHDADGARDDSPKWYDSCLSVVHAPVGGEHTASSWELQDLTGAGPWTYLVTVLVHQDELTVNIKQNTSLALLQSSKAMLTTLRIWWTIFKSTLLHLTWQIGTGSRQMGDIKFEPRFVVCQYKLCNDCISLRD